MFDVGFTEIILILGLALLVLGPEKLPALAEKVGRWTGRARAMARQLRTQLEHEVTMEELARSKPMHTSASSTPDSSTPVSSAPHQSAAEHESVPPHPGTPEHESASPATDPSTTKTTQ
jgi:sec-independent protein translocase protein TatB